MLIAYAILHVLAMPLAWLLFLYAEKMPKSTYYYVERPFMVASCLFVPLLTCMFVGVEVIFDLKNRKKG